MTAKVKQPLPEFVVHPADAQLLAGRRALVTGADSGIGQGIAFELAAHGAAVAINHLGEGEVAESMVEAISAAGGSAVAVAMDVSSEQQVTRGFAAAAEAIGGLDLLVNNAGVEAPFELIEMPLEQWQQVIDVNLTGTFLCSRAAARSMIEAGIGGVIVNITSVHEQIPWKQYSHYCASKGGTKLFSQSIARELAPRGIRVVSVAPGAITTPINAGTLDDDAAREAVESEIPLGRWGEVSDISRVVAFVASEQAGYIVGSTIFVDGGITLYPKFE